MPLALCLSDAAISVVSVRSAHLKNWPRTFFFSSYNSVTCDALIAGSLGTLSDEIV